MQVAGPEDTAMAVASSTTGQISRYSQEQIQQGVLEFAKRLTDAEQAQLAQFPAAQQREVIQKMFEEAQLMVELEKADAAVRDRNFQQSRRKRARTQEDEEAILNALDENGDYGTEIATVPSAYKQPVLVEQYKQRQDAKISKQILDEAYKAVTDLFTQPTPEKYLPTLMILVNMSRQGAQLTGNAVYLQCRDREGADEDQWLDSWLNNNKYTGPKYYGVSDNDLTRVQIFTLTLAKYIVYQKLLHKNYGKNEYTIAVQDACRNFNIQVPTKIGDHTPYKTYVEDVADNMISTTQFELQGFPQGAIVLHVMKKMIDAFTAGDFITFPNTSYRMFRAFKIMAKQRFYPDLEITDEDYTKPFGLASIARIANQITSSFKSDSLRLRLRLF